MDNDFYVCSNEHMGASEGGTHRNDRAGSSTCEQVDDMVLMAQVAQRHYVEGHQKVRIAQELGMSRFKVARLIRRSLEAGIVRFEISTVQHVDLALSVRLKEAFDLNQSVVVETPDESEETLQSYVGTAMTNLLGDIVGDSDILGLSATRALTGLQGPPSTFPKCPVVQMTGAFSRLDAADVMEGIRSLTRVGGGPAYLYYAPMVCREASDAGYVKRQEDYVRCQSMYKRLSVAGVGIGAWRDGLSQVYDAVSADERSSVRSLGIQAEVCGLLIHRQGNALAAPLNDRMVGISEMDFLKVPTRIGVVYGVEKSEAVQTVLSGRVINGLVTHRALAELLLQQPCRQRVPVT